MNIIVSGWPAAGATTLSLLLAQLLDYKYLYGGGVMKFLSSKVVGVDSGPKFIEFERYFGPYFDAIWDKYAVWKVQHSSHLILDGKAGGFFVEAENVFEIMVIASQHTREQRADTDLRILGSETLATRDQQIRSRWLSTYNIDIYDPVQIQLNYDLVLDTTNMSVEEELQRVLNYLEEDYRYPHTDLSWARSKIPELLALYKDEGKGAIWKLLEAKDSVYKHEIIFKEWKHQFAPEVKRFPPQIAQVIEAA
ncbi:MAG: hypothetical protein JNK26_01240 [Candidatus Doudnabacteria bacterium]|nr:hypothetical protein [Candidatus Doudnabacteria bacterium]